MEVIIKMGYWSGKGNGKGFYKRSCKDIKRFCGWNKIRKIYMASPDSETRLLVLTLIKTGGRISEVLDYTRDMFVLTTEFIRVYGLPVYKQHKNKSTGKKKKVFRNISIRRDEEMSAEFEEELNTVKDKLFSFKYSTAYKRIVKLDKDIFCHWFRGMRASQLAMEYRFGFGRLMRYFDWSEPETPLHYAKMDLIDLEKAMVRV